MEELKAENKSLKSEIKMLNGHIIVMKNKLKEDVIIKSLKSENKMLNEIIILMKKEREALKEEIKQLKTQK